ncbi:metallophosphoesterase [candidate division KD3-62 bacterium DG_56]|uniref:Metallophosphoesterase n=1 Tax=candidate division KD3-62 bacterium DG_56 TaxID=1704032 RepID=A0A0S7XMT0_9BACT|nr:MAG: metallophosphoesterase [candidate division KD3-62 bacterium DG_56]
MRVLFIGDIVGRPGRRAVGALLPTLRSELSADFVIANGENAAGGMGITADVTRELLAVGIDVITTGNHVWRNKGVREIIDQEPRLLRPDNYPPGDPGAGTGLFPLPDGRRVGVLNLCGRTFMEPIDCPFQAAEREVPVLRAETPVVVVDMHAEATSEKQAMAWMLDGQVSAVVGTHTHVETADERVMPRGTGYITDVGMTGPERSVLGMNGDLIVTHFRSRMPVKFEVAEGRVALCAVALEIDDRSGKANEIHRIRRCVDESADIEARAARGGERG